MAILLLELRRKPERSRLCRRAPGSPGSLAPRSGDDGICCIGMAACCLRFRSGCFESKNLARQMLADETAGKILPEGILEGRNVSEDSLRGAADGGDPAIVWMALPGVDWPRDDARWYWILMQAVWSGSLECFGLILSRAAANEQVSSLLGLTTLMHRSSPAWSLGNTDEGELQLVGGAAVRLGAKIDERDDETRSSTPLRLGVPVGEG